MDPQPSRVLVVAGLALWAVAAAAIVVVARSLTEPFWGTSYLVVGAMLVAVGVLLATHRSLGPGWVTWRRSLAALAAWAAAFPALWAALALVAAADAPVRTVWSFAVLAGTAHLPFVAAFSLLPLGAVRYLGRGSTRVAAGVVIALGVAAFMSFVLFFGDFVPFTAPPLVAWGPGDAVGATVTMLFLGTVLVGPAVALWAASRTEGEAARRLTLAGLSALAGAALVILCGALGTVAGDAAPVVLFCGMYLAVAGVAAGTTRALTTPTLVIAPSSDPAASDGGLLPVPAAAPATARLAPLTERESEVLSLLAEGLSNAGIAARLVLSERTVDAHLRSVFTKLALPEGRLENRRVHAARVWREAAQAVPEQAERAS